MCVQGWREPCGFSVKGNGVLTLLTDLLEAMCSVSWLPRNLPVSFTPSSQTKHAALTNAVSLANEWYPNPAHHEALCQEA